MNQNFETVKEQLLISVQKPRTGRKMVEEEKWKIKFVFKISAFVKKEKKKNQTVNH